MGNKAAITAAVFASGTGTNAENILRFAGESGGRLRIPFVICNKPGAGVIARAEKLGVPCRVFPVERDKFPTFNAARRAQEDKIIALLREEGVEWLLLAGYMQILTPDFIAAFRGRIVNVHPSLLPAFPGPDSYNDAWRAGVTSSGVTIHLVDEGVDTGPVIAQKSFPRLPGDTFEDFRARGLALEYEMYRNFLAHLLDELGPALKAAGEGKR